jgi:carbon-monoxide dehydrogenase medium subunit/6-hydroxypseudooxynicotine dehydrogenase subunit alpha
MKPPRFDYERPEGLDEALSVLASRGEGAKPLAGGQSLVPLLSFRLARPDCLVDLNRISELAYVRRDNGTLRIGAMTRQTVLERSDEAAAGWPLIVEAVRNVGHPQIRNRGTVGGSVAHADPAAELPAAFAALGATFHVRSARGGRTLRYDELAVTHLTTSLEPDELLVEIEVPALPRHTGTAFVEFARRHGDFALAGAAAVVTLSETRTCERVAIALLAAGPTAVRATEAEEWLTGSALDERAAAETAGHAAAAIRPPSDVHGSADFRRQLAEVMVRRALLCAAARATGGNG